MVTIAPLSVSILSKGFLKAFGVTASYFAKLRRFVSVPSGFTSNAIMYSPLVLFR